MTFSEMKSHSQQLFQEQQRASQAETTPRGIAPDAIELSIAIGAEPPEFVPVMPDEIYGMFGYCADGVTRKVSADGGGIVFGRCVWEYPGLFLDGEFHAVWRSPAGELIDITPKPGGEERILFAAEPSIPANFDFIRRPRNARRRIYPDQDIVGAAEQMIANLLPHQQIYESKRAAKVGLTLHEWMAKKVPLDPMPRLIDDFIDGANKLDEMGKLLSNGGTLINDPYAYNAIARRQQERLARIKSILGRTPSDLAG